MLKQFTGQGNGQLNKSIKLGEITDGVVSLVFVNFLGRLVAAVFGQNTVVGWTYHLFWDGYPNGIVRPVLRGATTKSCHPEAATRHESKWNE